MPIIDIGFSVSVILTAVSLFGFFLFTWEWKRKGRASAVFVYVTIILMGLAMENAAEAYSKYAWMNYGCDTFRMTIWWPLRNMVILVATASLVVHMLHRIIVKDTSNHKE